MKLSDTQRALFDAGELVRLSEALEITHASERQLLISRCRREWTVDGEVLFNRRDLYE